MYTSKDILSFSPSELADLDLFDRYEFLENLGMLADEGKIGFPERPYEEWSEQDFEAVSKIFETWPMHENQDKLQKLFSTFKIEYHHLAEQSESSVESVVKRTAKAFSLAAQKVYGQDFPEIDIVISDQGASGYYGGLRSDGKIQLNSSKFKDGFVKHSSFSGSMAFAELLCHESVHKLQRYLSENSDGETQDERLSARVSEQFYEATQGAKSVGRRELYWGHPMEVQARNLAKLLVNEIT